MQYDDLKLERQLCFPMYVCSREVIKRYKPFLDALHLTYTQYIVMLALWEKDDISVKDLGDILYLDSGTLTPLLKKLKAKQILTLERDERDRRSVVVRATASGMALRDRAVEVPEKVGACVPLSAKEAQTLYVLMYKILGSVRKRDSEQA